MFAELVADRDAGVNSCDGSGRSEDHHYEEQDSRGEPGSEVLYKVGPGEEIPDIPPS